MDHINNKYYKGFEGEQEIQFIRSPSNGDRTILSIWCGYFDDIMRLFQPTESGWTGLAYYYNLDIGWYEESPWKIPDVIDALHQFESLNHISGSHFKESQEILNEIRGFLSAAIKQNDGVWIAEE